MGASTIWLLRGLWLGWLCIGVSRRRPARCICLWGPIYLAVSSAQSIGIVLEPLLGITEDFIGCLNSLESGDELLFLTRVSVGVELEG